MYSHHSMALMVKVFYFHFYFFDLQDLVLLVMLRYIMSQRFLRLCRMAPLVFRILIHFHTTTKTSRTFSSVMMLSPWTRTSKNLLDTKASLGKNGYSTIDCLEPGGYRENAFGILSNRFQVLYIKIKLIFYHNLSQVAVEVRSRTFLSHVHKRLRVKLLTWFVGSGFL